MKFKIPLIFQALLLQLLALLVLACAVYGLAFLVPPPYHDMNLVAGQAVLAAILSFRLPVWWRWIQFLLPILLWLGLLLFNWLQINPVWSLVGFILIWLVFKNAVQERVPLYLTNATTRAALAELIAEFKTVNFADLGCGIGSNLGFVAQQPAVVKTVGVETALASYWLAKIRSFWNKSQVERTNLWDLDLAEFNLVYVFLSPEPMAKIGAKALAEMPADGVLVSNSFPIPGLVAEVWELNDRRKTELYIYRIAKLRAQQQAQQQLIKLLES